MNTTERLALARGLLNCYQYAAYTGQFLSAERFGAMEMQSLQSPYTHPDLSDWENERRRVLARLWEAIELVDQCSQSAMFNDRQNLLWSLRETMLIERDYLSIWREV